MGRLRFHAPASCMGDSVSVPEKDERNSCSWRHSVSPRCRRLVRRSEAFCLRMVHDAHRDGEAEEELDDHRVGQVNATKDDP